MTQNLRAARGVAGLQEAASKSNGGVIRLGGLTVVGLQQTAQSFSTEDRTLRGLRGVRLDDPMTENPVRAFPEVILAILPNNIAEVFLTDQDHLVQTL